MEVSDARRMKALRAENVKPKKRLAEVNLDNATPKDIASKNATLAVPPFCLFRLRKRAASRRPQNGRRMALKGA